MERFDLPFNMLGEKKAERGSWPEQAGHSRRLVTRSWIDSQSVFFFPGGHFDFTRTIPPVTSPCQMFRMTPLASVLGPPNPEEQIRNWSTEWTLLEGEHGKVII